MKLVRHTLSHKTNFKISILFNADKNKILKFQFYSTPIKANFKFTTPKSPNFSPRQILSHAHARPLIKPPRH